MAMSCARIHPWGYFTRLSSYKQQQVCPRSNQCSRPSFSLTGKVFQGLIQRRPARDGWKRLVSRMHRGSVHAVLTSDPASNIDHSNDKSVSSNELEVLASVNGSLKGTVEELKELLTIKDYMVQVQDFIKPDGGPPRWFSPINVGQYPEDAPLLLFIPGMDSTGLGLLLHQQKLARLFEVRCFHIPLYDRTPFEGILEIVEAALKEESSKNPDRPIYLVAESFGCSVSLSLAARNPDLDLVLVLVNPATCFETSPLQPLLPLLEVAPAEVFRVVPFLLSFTLGDPVRMVSAGIETDLPPLLRAQKIADGLQALLPTLPTLADILPKEVLEWKIKLIGYGARYTNSRLRAVKAETLLLVSGQDQMLPSVDEAKRLKRILPNCQVRLFPNNGHTLLLEEGPNLNALIKGTSLYRRGKTFDIIRDYIPPTVDEIKFARSKTIESLRQFFSPVSFATNEEGKIRRGFPSIPDNRRPLLFVGNHTFVGFDLGFLVDEILTNTGRVARGLAHPIIARNFEPPNSSGNENLPEAGTTDVFRLMGIVPVNGTNLYRILGAGQCALLYPGGVREALKRKGEAYKLIWSEKPEFVRTAIRHGATIIPVAAVGGDDIVEILLDPEELTSLPFIGEQIKKSAEQIPRARLTGHGEVANEEFVTPFGVPKIPPRMYFCFGKPIETHGMSHLVRDRQAAEELYSHVRGELEASLKFLLDNRGKDPYKDFFPRLVFEKTWNKQAPTFEV